MQQSFTTLCLPALNTWETVEIQAILHVRFFYIKSQPYTFNIRTTTMGRQLSPTMEIKSIMDSERICNNRLHTAQNLSFQTQGIAMYSVQGGRHSSFFSQDLDFSKCSPPFRPCNPLIPRFYHYFSINNCNLPGCSCSCFRMVPGLCTQHAQMEDFWLGATKN